MVQIVVLVVVIIASVLAVDVVVVAVVGVGGFGGGVDVVLMCAIGLVIITVFGYCVFLVIVIAF